jgi:hypothetical protein
MVSHRVFSLEANNVKRNFLLLLCLAALAALLTGCVGDLMTGSRFGMYGGKQPESKPEPPFDINSTDFGLRWFPAHVRWAPDDSHLLVSLCHMNRTSYCRIGKYWIADDRWELLDLQPRTTYRWPSYSPDGKHIVASVGSCDENYQCSRKQYALALLSPDGRHATKLADTIALHPTFSNDGNKIIYWRSNGAALDVAQFDLTIGKEQILMQLYWQGNQRGWPVFLPDAKKYVFAGWMRITSPPSDDLRPGTKLDGHGGPYPDVIMYAVDIAKGVVTRFNAMHLEPLWPGPGGGIGGGPLDVSTDGQILYRCSWYMCLKAKRAAGIYQAAQPLPQVPLGAPTPAVLMLRPAVQDANDTAAFIFYASPQDAAISHDKSRVAFSEMNPIVPDNTRRLGIATLGNTTPYVIDWPRMELDPAATQPPKQSPKQ